MATFLSTIKLLLIVLKGEESIRNSKFTFILSFGTDGDWTLSTQSRAIDEAIVLQTMVQRDRKGVFLAAKARDACIDQV